MISVLNHWLAVRSRLPEKVCEKHVFFEYADTSVTRVYYPLRGEFKYFSRGIVHNRPCSFTERCCKINFRQEISLPDTAAKLQWPFSGDVDPKSRTLRAYVSSLLG